jgi:SAM-dependent methyltransferase
MSHDHSPPGADDEFAELLDLDFEVVRPYWTDALSWVRRAATGQRHILDLGAGTGTATIALAQRFAGAAVVAVDASESMLARVRTKALDLGLADRIRTVPADLDELGRSPIVGPLDVTWASMSLHHLTDPDRVLGEIFAATRPGGLLAVAELTEQLRFLPDDLGIGRPGLEARCVDLMRVNHAHAVPELGSDWPARIVAAGFTLIGERTFTIALDPPQPRSAVRYAQLWLRRLRAGLADQLAPDDRQTLDVLLDDDGPHSPGRRADLRISGRRTVTLARRVAPL